MNTILTAAQINRLAQRLSNKPLGRSASATTAAERLQRLLAVRIGAERAAATAQVILGAPGFETAEGRLVAEIECDEDEADVGTMVAAAAAPAPAPAPVSEIAAKSPATPTCRCAPAPEGCGRRSPRPARRTAAAAGLHGGDPRPVPGQARRARSPRRERRCRRLRAVTINPVSSSPKARARYRDLAVLAIEAREALPRRLISGVLAANRCSFRLPARRHNLSRS